MDIKQRLRQRFPTLVDSVQRLRGKDLFTRVYAENRWSDAESRSGSGSTLENTATIRALLPGLLHDLGARSLLDIPCGDFNWMKAAHLDLDLYTGADVVRRLVQDNSQRFGNATTKFVELNIMKHTLPQVDVVFCRDCLVHFSDADVLRSIANIRRSRSRYLLTTTFPDHHENAPITTGGWRPLNLQIAPFHFPPPLQLLNEQYTGDGGQYADKSLGLWRVEEIADCGFRIAD